MLSIGRAGQRHSTGQPIFRGCQSSADSAAACAAAALQLIPAVHISYRLQQPAAHRFLHLHLLVVCPGMVAVAHPGAVKPAAGAAGLGAGVRVGGMFHVLVLAPAAVRGAGGGF